MPYLSETCPEKKDPKRTPRRKTVEVKGCFHWSPHTRLNCRHHTTTDFYTLLYTFSLTFYISSFAGLVGSLSFGRVNKCDTLDSLDQLRQDLLACLVPSGLHFTIVMTCFHSTLHNLVCESVGVAVISQLGCLFVRGGGMMELT